MVTGSGGDVPTQSVGTRRAERGNKEMMPDLTIRPLTFADVPRLSEIDAEFESDRFLDVDKTMDGLEVTWRLVERPLDPPFRSTDYGLDGNECDEIGAGCGKAMGCTWWRRTRRRADLPRCST